MAAAFAPVLIPPRPDVDSAVVSFEEIEDDAIFPYASQAYPANASQKAVEALFQYYPNVFSSKVECLLRNS